MFRAAFIIRPLLVLCTFCILPCGKGQEEQKVDHRIQVRLDDEKDLLHGEQEIRYINRSNTELQCIYFHLWPEAYSAPNTALSRQKREEGDLSLYYAADEERGYMDSLDFKVEGRRVPFYRSKEHRDIGHILLNEPLEPGDTILIKNNFRTKIPDARFSRMGADDDAYRITQWYPKPATYDEDAWHPMPYLDQGEFYNEFGSYEVSITLPANYTVGATGRLVEGSEEKERLSRIAEETAHLDSFPEKPQDVASSEEMKTLRYRADRVTDFAWFADKRYRVLQERVQLPRSERTVLARVFFTDHEAERWEHSMEYLKAALYYYSLWVGPYPHDRISVASSQSGSAGGMEYPGIAVIGPTSSHLQLERIIAHEVGHNWFQATLANDERRDPWMDEGLNSYYETRYMRVRHPDIAPFEGSLPRPVLDAIGLGDKGPMFQHYLQYRLSASLESDQPLSTRSERLTSTNYGTIVYSKGALLFDHLEEYLGQEKLDRAVRNYYSEWAFSHPEPEDLERSFRNVTEQELKPFFEDFLHTTGKIDMELKDVSMEGGFKYGESYSVTMENEGDIAAPFPLTTIHADTMVEEKWIEGFEGEERFQLQYHTGKVEAFATDGQERTPDIERSNDRYANRTLFSKWEKPVLKPLFGIDQAHEKEFYAFPTLGWNRNDGFMSGIGIHDQNLTPGPFDFVAAPMYAWKSGRITGLASVGWNAWWDGSPILDHMRLSATFKRFTNGRGAYERVAPRLEFWYEKGEARSPHRHRTIFEAPMIRRKNPVLTEEGVSLERERSFFYRLEQVWKRSAALLPMEARVQGLYHDDFTRISGTWRGAFRYNEDLDELKLRVFAGGFLRSEHLNPAFNLRMDGRGPSGASSDFLFEHHFFGRGDRRGIWSQQFVRSEGGFYTPTAIGSSNRWIASVGTKFDLPFPDDPDLSLFFDHGWAPDPFSDELLGLYEGGIGLRVLNDVLTVHFPILLSPNIEQEHEINDIGTGERIRFQLRLDRLKPFERLRTHNL